MSATGESGRARIAAWVLVSVWLLLNAWRTVVGHLSFATNAYDLSVFDYALWNLFKDGGFVPFLGQSIFSHHFMPILWVISPIHAIAPYPLTLLFIQLLSTAGAALLFLKIQRQQGLDGWLPVALMLVFLMARRTHGAVAGSFYPEAFQAPLTFAMVLLWPSQGWRLWACVLLLLMTKEDASIYVAGFAAIALMRSMGSRRAAAALLAVAVVWFAGAMFLAIPRSRAIDGLGASNPLMAERYGAAGGSIEWTSLVERVGSPKTARTLENISATAGFLPLAGLWWMAPAVPGLIANLMASPETMQSTVTSHYAWPVLPWLFIAASSGLIWIQRRWRTMAHVWVALLLLVTIADNPALQRVGSTRLSAETQQVRAQLAQITEGTILAQPNLIPHLTKTPTVFAVGGVVPSAEPDWVLLTSVGGLWPFTPDEIRTLVATYRADSRYVEVSAGPLYAFRRR